MEDVTSASVPLEEGSATQMGTVPVPPDQEPDARAENITGASAAGTYNEHSSS